MNTPGTLIGRRCDELIADAAYQKALLVLTCKSNGRWQTHKSRILDIAQARRALVVAYPRDVDEGTLELARGEQVGVSFRNRSKKCLFSTTVIGKRQPRRTRMRSPNSKALLLEWPGQIEQLQRRVYHRVLISPDAPVEVKLWEGGTNGLEQIPPENRKIVTGRLLDLSVGGTRIEVDPNDNPHFGINDLVGITFRTEPDEPEFLLEGCFRHLQAEDDDQVSLGFQFIGLEVSLETPPLLNRLARSVSKLQREEYQASLDRS